MSGGIPTPWRGLARLSLLRAILMPLASVIPASRILASPYGDEDAAPAWVYLACAALLVILGGAFSGLTIALMGQDEINLKVLQASGEPAERRDATKVLRLLERGKHWVLVTLLLGNVITNETLPIVLDRSLGGGWQAVLGSTVLIVIFGEIVPQSVCVRFGLPIGAFMAPFTRLLMWLLAPVGYPTARLLDFLLGQDHGTTYKKDGLKTLVTLHRSYGISPGDRLNRDEVTIISAVLDLRAKPVGSIMTPMEDVFTLAADTILDAEMMDTILSEGYSRVPIYTVDDPKNFVGMLLVKMLITYDPEDCLRVDEFPLATLPETRPETSCLDIVNFFQEGKSHMVLVSASPGEPYGALGVCTLEDVIEELIGEEIIDESDVFVDVHKAIRRMHPVSYYRIPKAPVGKAFEDAEGTKITLPRKLSALSDSKGPTARLKRRRSSGGMESIQVEIRNQDAQLRQHLSHLGPSNLASAPKQTRINTVKIKPAQVTLSSPSPPRPISSTPDPIHNPKSRAASNSLLPKENRQSCSPDTSILTAGYPASDGVHALNYGTLNLSPKWKPKTPVEHLQQAPTEPSPLRISEGVYSTEDGDDWAHSPTSKDPEPRTHDKPSRLDPADGPLSYASMAAAASLGESYPAKLVITPERSIQQSSNENESLEDENESSQSGTIAAASSSIAGQSVAGAGAAGAAGAASSADTHHSGPRAVRSGSIFQRGLEVDGVPKVVLDVHEDGPEQHGVLLVTGTPTTGIGVAGEGTPGPPEINEDRAASHRDAEADAEPRKKRRKRYKKKKPKGGPSAGDGEDLDADGGVAL